MAWPKCEILFKSAMHYSALSGIVWGDSKYHRDLRTERERYFERFSYLKFSLRKLNPLCALCLSQRRVNEWTMNNAGQDPFVWRRPSVVQGAAQETLWNIDSPLKNCCVDAAQLLGCEWKFFFGSSFCFPDELRIPENTKDTHQVRWVSLTSFFGCSAGEDMIHIYMVGKYSVSSWSRQSRCLLFRLCLSVRHLNFARLSSIDLLHRSQSNRNSWETEPLFRLSITWDVGSRTSSE